MGQNWWFLFWHISAVLTYCLLIQEDIDKEGDFCGKVKLKGLTWFHLDSVSLHLSSLIPSSELSCIPDFRWFRDKMRNSFALSRAFIDLWPWMAPYIPGFIIILGTSPLLTVLCQWREWSACHFFFLWFRHPKKWLHTDIVTSLLLLLWKQHVQENLFPSHPLIPEHRYCRSQIAPAPLGVSCGAVRGLGDSPRNLRRKSVGTERQNMSDPSFPTHIQGGGSGDRC